MPSQVKRVVVWPPGKPWLWEFKHVEDKPRKERPSWYWRARELKAAGYSYRAIAKEIGVSDRTLRREILN